MAAAAHDTHDGNGVSRHDKILFWGCFVALVTTSFGFITRMFLLGTWATEFNLDPAQVGLYAVAVNLTNLLLKVPEATGTVLYPRLAAAGGPARSRRDRRCEPARPGAAGLVHGRLPRSRRALELRGGRHRRYRSVRLRRGHPRRLVRRLGRGRLRMVLEAIEDHYRGWKDGKPGLGDERVARGRLAIEHVMR